MIIFSGYDTHMDEDGVQLLVKRFQRFAAELFHHRANHFLRGGFIQKAPFDQEAQRLERSTAHLCRKK